MPINLIDSVNGLLGSDVVSGAGTALDEDHARVQDAMSGIVPSVLAGILNKAGSGDAGEILTMAKDTANSGILSNIGNFLGNDSLLSKGADLLKSIFGNRLVDVVNTISNYYGIRSASATSLMSIAAPAAFGTLGEHAQATGMDANDLLSFLNSQKVSILSALPSELNIAGAMGLSSIVKIESKLSRSLYDATAHVRDMQHNIEKTKTSRWLVPALVAIGFIGLIWFFSGRKNNEPEEGQVVASTNEPGAIASAPRLIVMVRLPDGTQINAYKGGIEDQLVAFLNDPSRPVDNTTWFDFDNLNFEPGSSTITATSMPQIHNIAMILKAFPDANIKIGGYTDKTGNEAANMKLSQARADAVLTELKNNGITNAQLSGAEGYGSQFARAPADASDEVRKKDRRIAVSVRKK